MLEPIIDTSAPIINVKHATKNVSQLGQKKIVLFPLQFLTPLLNNNLNAPSSRSNKSPYLLLKLY